MFKNLFGKKKEEKKEPTKEEKSKELTKVAKEKTVQINGMIDKMEDDITKLNREILLMRNVF